jgi:hypothetical protein
LVLLGAGLALRPLADAVRKIEVPPGGAGRPGHLGAIVGSGMSLAALGGFRALAADLLWLKTYGAWAACDPAATQALVRLVTTIDERPLRFWLNGARIMAYDVAAWRLQSERRGPDLPAEVRRRIVDEQARAALEYLADARCHHPESAALCIEIANLHLNRQADLAAAAAWYRLAAESPGAPYYAARIHAELLQRLGRQQEAYAWLCRIHPTLPAGEKEAMAALVLRRIRDLERTLQVPETERYRHPEASPGAGRPQKRGIDSPVESPVIAGRI